MIKLKRAPSFIG